MIEFDELVGGFGKFSEQVTELSGFTIEFDQLVGGFSMFTLQILVAIKTSSNNYIM